MNIYSEIQKLASWVKAGDQSMINMVANKIKNSGINYEEDLALFESRSDLDVRQYL